MPDGFEPLDFHRFHREELPRRLRAGNGALAARDARRLGSLAFRLPDGAAYTYLPAATTTSTSCRATSRPTP